MWKLDFYLLPSLDYYKINTDDVLKLADNIDNINTEDNFVVPDMFYSEMDINQVNAADFLFGNEQNDITSYLFEIISKQKRCSEDYEVIEQKSEKGYMVFPSDDIPENKKEVCVRETQNFYDGNRLTELNHIIKVRRHYLLKTITFKIEYQGYGINCNPHTKFYDGYNNQRIYFGWGRDEIEKHRIIIARIGDHWSE